MRRLLFTLMILLLPLRGWVGDAMAVQMAMPGGGMPHVAAAAPTHGSDHHAAAAQADHGHEVHAKAGNCTDRATDDTAALDTHCQTCTMCQACHTVAITMPPTALAGTERVNPSPSSWTQHFASADRALGQKPPIS